MLTILKRKNYHLVIFITAIHFLSCSKKKDDNNAITGPCSDFIGPYVTNDGPVQMGSSLRLNASSDEDNITYEWTGPKNFSSDDQNPIISNISFDAGGAYFARVISSACTSSTSLTNVVVNVPCTIADNTGVFGSTQWTFNSSITCGINAYGYTMTASSINGELKIKFATANAPTVNKILKVDDPGTASFDSTEVQLSITSGWTTYTGQSGNVYVSNYGTLSVAFCGVPFKSSGTGVTLTGGAKVNCQ